MADSVALTALVISLVALFTTIGQLLQQYFATADGYRRCQPSVMGLWARKTKLRWRWAEFRFETIFVIPRIIYKTRVILEKSSPGMTAVAGDDCPLTNTATSLDTSMTLGGWPYGLAARRFYSGDELACWVPLLAQLHRQGETISERFPAHLLSDSNGARNVSVPVVQFVQKSWDFMPGDIVRPMASSTISDIAIMARRLGMVWKSFDPGSGSMRAEGNGHTITSTVARSFGVILQYTFTSRDTLQQCCYVPTIEADKLGFGLVALDPSLFPNVKFDLDLGSYQGLERTLPFLYHNLQVRPSKRARSVLRELDKAMKVGDDFILGLNDLIPLLSGMLATPRLRKIPSPNLYSKGVTASEEGFRVFSKRLESLVSTRGTRATKQSREILSYVQDIDDKYNSLGESERQSFRQYITEDAKPEALFLRYYGEMTRFLREVDIHYDCLVWVHLAQAVMPLKPLTDRYKAFDLYGLDPEEVDERLVTSMESYFDALSRLPSRFAAYSYTGWSESHLPELEDAWLSMMFRAFCWQRIHEFIEGVPPLPSEYWNSKMPVYIG